MIKVFQNEYSPTTGDCQRACTASIFELKIEQVPHFRLFNDDLWWTVFCGFIWSMGYEVLGTGKPKENVFPEHSIDGLILACVPVQTGKNLAHNVILNLKGIVVHDPDKNENWLGKNVLKSGDLDSWDIIKKRQE